MPRVDTQVWKLVSETGPRWWTCRICEDGSARKESNLTKHELTATHQNARDHKASTENSNWTTLPITTIESHLHLAEHEQHYSNFSSSFNPYAWLNGHDENTLQSSSDVHDNSAINFDIRWGDLMIDDAAESQASEDLDEASRMRKELAEFLDHSSSEEDDGADPTDSERSDSGLAESTSEERVTEILRSGLGQKRTRGSQESSALWYPWPDKITCTMDILMHLHRSAFSNRQIDLFLWLLEENGVNDLPSLRVMGGLDKTLQDLCGIKTHKFDGPLGHAYFVNDIGKIIAQEMANPRVRPYLHFYPEDAGSALEETWQADHWLKDVDANLLTPMLRVGNQDYYIYEPALLRDNNICIPVRWFLRDGIPCARVWQMKLSEIPGLTGWIVYADRSYEIRGDQLSISYGLLQSTWSRYGIHDPSNIIGYFTDSSHTALTPWNFTNPIIGNRWRVRAQGARVYTFPIWLYCDDTSGNVSKRWNKHNSFLFTAAGLPQSKVHEEYNTHFLCTSNKAPPLEMLDGIEKLISSCQHEGIWTWDCVHNEPVLVIPFVYALLGDNPMQSEMACHIGLRGKCFCRVCDVKGHENINPTNDDVDGRRSDESHESDASSAARSSTSKKSGQKPKRKPETSTQMFERIERFMKTGVARTKSITMGHLSKILAHYCTLGEKHKADKLKTEKGVKDTFQEHFLANLAASHRHAKTAAQKIIALSAYSESLPQNTSSPVWRLQGLDPHKHTPVEILHVVLLGFTKYFWRDVVQNQLKNNTTKKELLEIRLNNLDVTGLGVSRISGHTLVQYAGSLTGGDFRLIAQIAPFVLYDLVQPECYSAWICLSRLIPAIWQPKISDRTKHIRHIHLLIREFMVTMANWTPRWFNKPKFHILLHLVRHIQLYGPAILFATENFESYNAVIRNKSVHSNHHAPSKDIAISFAQHNRIRHLLSGGALSLNADTNGNSCEVRNENIRSDPTLINAGKAGLWKAVGRGPQHLVALPNAVTGYLGLREKRIRQFFPSSMHYITGSLKFHRTRTSKYFSNIMPGDEIVQECDIVELDEVDKLKRLGWVFVNTPQSVPNTPHGHPSVALVQEILQINSRMISRQHESVIVLVRFADVQSCVQPYNMPGVSPSSKHGIFYWKDIICAVNTQHNCYANHCDTSGTQFVVEEREKTKKTVPAVQHYNEDDRILNLGQMRHSCHFRHFDLPVQTWSSVEYQEAIRRAVEVEIIRNKDSRKNGANKGTEMPDQRSGGDQAPQTSIRVLPQRVQELGSLMHIT